MKLAQNVETNKWGRHLISQVGEGAVGGQQSRTASISSTASTEEIPWDSVSKEEHQLIEVHKLHIDKK